MLFDVKICIGEGVVKKVFFLELFFYFNFKEKNMYFEGINVFNWLIVVIFFLRNIVWLYIINVVKIRFEIKGNYNFISVYLVVENDFGK